MLKKLLCLLLIIPFSLAVTSCGTDDENGTPPSTGDNGNGNGGDTGNGNGESGEPENTIIADTPIWNWMHFEAFQVQDEQRARITDLTFPHTVQSSDRIVTIPTYWKCPTNGLRRVDTIAPEAFRSQNIISVEFSYARYLRQIHQLAFANNIIEESIILKNLVYLDAIGERAFEQAFASGGNRELSLINLPNLRHVQTGAFNLNAIEIINLDGLAKFK